MYEFSKAYSALLDNLQDGCNGNPDVLKEGISLMCDLKYKAAALMNIPPGDGFMAGPSFECISPDLTQRPLL